MHPLRSSATARLIARCTLLAARDPVRRALVPAGAETPLSAMLAAEGGARWFGYAARHRWSRGALAGLERAVLPGITTHYLARKSWLECAVRRALRDGTRQVVVLGAGFDTLAWRLHREAPDVRFFELDHPATQAPKRRALGGAENLFLLPCDLARVAPTAVLRGSPKFEPDQPALFLAEGLLMYLPEEQVAALLRDLRSLPGAGLALLFTFMARAPDGAITFRGEHAAVGWWLRRRGEPFRWGISVRALPAFLASLGWRAEAVADHTALRTEVLAPRGLAALPLARGECLCRCVPASDVPS